jgi:hypothetical protein
LPSRAHARLGADLAAKEHPSALTTAIAATVAIDFDLATRDLRSFPKIAASLPKRW